MFQISYSKKAVKFLKRQDVPSQKRLIAAISRLPLAGDIKKLQGIDGYRLRVGNFRVLFNVNGIIIDIIDIGNRGQIYKGV
nr:type II toxin-antitoxin system RelE/ParE family toxin [uncultured Blautia sp.]